MASLMEEIEPEYQSRKGYFLKDLARSFIQSLSESGASASGKLLHYTADFICSGGLPLWQKLCWDYAFDHISIANPRIFLYLVKRFKEIDNYNSRLPFEVFYNSEAVQKLSAEVVLVLQNNPQKTRIRPPNVPQNTHENEDWLVSNLKASDKEAVSKVYSRSQDQPVVYHVGNELVSAIIEGGTEKALFWMRWLLEEDMIVRKKLGGGLSTCERGPATMPTKQRQSIGFFICSILAEVYKELAEKKHIRMHEEYQNLLDLYRSTDGTFPTKHKINALILMIQILCEVPRWKVPAAPSLVGDPLVLQRATGTSINFYKEIIAYPMPSKPMPKTVGSLALRKVKSGDTKADKINSQLEAADEMLLSLYGGF